MSGESSVLPLGNFPSVTNFFVAQSRSTRCNIIKLVHCLLNAKQWSAVAGPQQHREINRNKSSGTPRIEPGASGSEARTNPLCYATPETTLTSLFETGTDGWSQLPSSRRSPSRAVSCRARSSLFLAMASSTSARTFLSCVTVSGSRTSFVSSVSFCVIDSGNESSSPTASFFCKRPNHFELWSASELGLRPK